MPHVDFRPGIQEPVLLVFSREQVEAGEIGEPMEFLSHIAGSARAAAQFMGRVSLIVDGYNDDPRELFEIPEVRRYVRKLDDAWPYWFFFLSQADDSIKTLEACLCDSVEIVPGVASIDLQQLEHYLGRHFAAFNRLCDALNLPEDKNREISDGIIALIQNATVERVEGDSYE
jgi:hypothetical protein